jgi:hypothetical protein
MKESLSFLIAPQVAKISLTRKPNQSGGKG